MRENEHSYIKNILVDFLCKLKSMLSKEIIFGKRGLIATFIRCNTCELLTIHNMLSATHGWGCYSRGPLSWRGLGGDGLILLMVGLGCWLPGLKN